MKAATREWIRKAESDYQLAVSLMRRRKLPVRDHVCFHFQQSAEKYVKARLEEAGVPFPKTHDIAALLQAAASVEPLWAAMTVAARRLNKFAVNVRYPGDDATPSEMRRRIRMRRKSGGKRAWLCVCEFSKRLAVEFVLLGFGAASREADFGWQAADGDRSRAILPHGIRQSEV